MVSIGFDAVAGLDGLSFTIKSVLAGRVHQITRAATRRTDLHMLHDALGGMFIALDEAPAGSLLPKEHVLLVAVQRVDGLWVLRGMRIGAYFSAIKVEAADVVKYGSVHAAVLDAQQVTVGIPDGNVATAKPRRIGATETTVAEWVRGVERRYLATGVMWASRGDGTVGLGLPQLQFVVGGDFTAAATGWGEGRLASVRSELREVGDELALLTPVGHEPPPSERQPASGSSLTLPGSGADPGATPVAALPMRHLADASPLQPVPLASPQPPLVSEVHPPSEPASVMSLKDLSTDLPLQYGAYHFLDPRRSAPARFGLGMQGTLYGHTAQAGGVAREDPAEWRELARDLHAERALDRSQQRPKSYWDERLRAVVRGVDGSSVREWVTGMPVAASMACGPRVGVMLDEDRALAVSGGEGRFMLRGDEARASEFAWALGEDGFREGWCERAAQFPLVSFGEGGVPFDGDTGLPLESADLAALPPAVQLECRARAELGDVEVLAISAGKRAGTHVSLDVQLENHRELCELQAKFDFTAAYTTDAGTGLSRCEDTVLRDGMGNPIPCVSQAAGRHDGVVCSGTIEATRGLDNYVGEMAALLLAITDAAEGGRVLVVLDASSPVCAWLRFRGRHNRHKLDYYAARLLDSLDQALQKLEVVVFFWQTSHVGSPTNEWADLLATAALLMKVAPFVLSPMSFASMRYSRPPKSLFRWALERGRRVVFGRLTEGISHTVFFEEGDVRLGGFVKEAEEISAAVRQGTLLLADRLGRMSTAAADMVRGAGCVCGAVREGRPVLPTWSHVCFWCVAPEYRRPREEILRAVGGVELGDVFSGAAMAGTHRQLSGAVQYLRGPAANHDFNLRDEQGREAEGEMRRLFGACILGAGDRWIDRSALVRQALRRLVLAGAELLQLAGVQEAQLAKDVAELNCRAYLMRWVFKPWRDLVRRSGPGRVAALADIRLSRRTVALAITRSTREGEFSRLWGWIAWRRLVREVRAARSEVEASREDDCRAPALWRIAAAVRVRRWRAVAVAERRQRQGGWVRLQAVRSLDHSATLSRFVWAALRSHELPDLVDDRVATRVGEWGLEVGRRELALRALRRCMFFRLGARRGAGAGDFLSQARQCWLAGEWRAQVCRQAAAMARWRRIGGNHSLSGRPRLAERVMPFDRFERVAPVRVRRSLVVEAARRRAMRGEAGDMVDRWAVEGVVEARRATSGGIWGRVRWVGVDPSTGEHWGDTWERVRGMTADLRKVVMGLLPVRGVCKRTQVGGVVVQGSRRSPRLIEVEAAGVTRGGAAQGCEGEGGGGGGVGVSGEGGWPVGHRTSKRRVLSLVERARRATEMRVRRGGERREEEERVLEFRRVEEQQRGERGVRAERRRGGALAGGKRWVSEGGVGLGGGGEGGGVLSAASAGREGGWVVGGRLRRARLLTGGSKREFGEGLAVGAVTTARAVEEAEAVVDRRGRAGLRLRRPSVGSAL